tara:strand:+ start:3543 stop:4229 length:687 start_codon:yes stop_codon:yes gene_type:complete
MDQKLSSPKSVLSHITDFLLKEGLTLITGAALGATIALALSYKDATDFWTMVGSLLAGLGTVGLLAFGWIKAGDWIKEAKHSKKLEFEASLASDISKHAIDLLTYFTGSLIPKVVGGNLRNDIFFYQKLFNEYSIKIELSVVTAKTLIRINHNKNEHDNVTNIELLKSNILKAANYLAEAYPKAALNSIRITDLDNYLNEDVYAMNLTLINLLKEISDEYFSSLSSRD